MPSALHHARPGPRSKRGVTVPVAVAAGTLLLRLLPILSVAGCVGQTDRPRAAPPPPARPPTGPDFSFAATAMTKLDVYKSPPVRAGAGQAPIAAVSPQTPLKVTAIVGDWLYVESPPECQGWVEASGLRPEEGPADAAMARITAAAGGGGALPADVERLREQYFQWRAVPTKRHFYALQQGIADLAGQRSITSKVALRTLGKDRQETMAKIRYRYTHVDTIHTAKNPTACTEEMTIGRYYIWAERDGVPTSRREDWFDVIKPDEAITLQEDR